jgi:hypothetical protein
MRLPRRSEVDAAHLRRRLRKDVDESFALQHLQRIAHRRLADAEPRGQFRAHERRARRELQRHDHLPQRLEHLRCGLAVAVEADRLRHAGLCGVGIGGGADLMR